MEIHLKINDVRGQDEKGRHILWINDQDLRLWLEEHQQYVIQTILQPMLKHHPGKLQEIIDDPTMRNVIYMQEKAKREQKSENRKRMKQAEIDKQRRRDQFIASKNYRQSVDYIHNVLGWNYDNGAGE
jgi:chromosomal replication initiation ATPase DnaA